MPPLILVSMDVAWLASRRCDCLRERAGIASTHDTSSLLSFSLPPSSSVSLFLSTSPPFLSMLPPLVRSGCDCQCWSSPCSGQELPPCHQGP
ncbi:hypothetical protein VDGL01_00868 [Verticillium dahliae]